MILEYDKGARYVVMKDEKEFYGDVFRVDSISCEREFPGLLRVTLFSHSGNILAILSAERVDIKK